MWKERDGLERGLDGGLDGGHSSDGDAERRLEGARPQHHAEGDPADGHYPRLPAGIEHDCHAGADRWRRTPAATGVRHGGAIPGWFRRPHPGTRRRKSLETRTSDSPPRGESLIAYACT